MSYRNKRPIELAQQVTLDLCELVDSPRSLTVQLLIQYEQWDELIQLSTNPNNYSDVQSFKDDYLISEVLKKHPGLDAGIDRAKVAEASFLEAEAHCRLSNDRLSNEVDNDLIINMQRHIKTILGPLDKRCINEIVELMEHGPGASYCIKGRGSVQSKKFRFKQPSLTANLVPFVRSIIGDSWSDNVESFFVVPGNRFTTVPKNAKTDRGICIEPLINLYCQKGVGTYIKRRLRRAGCDLSQQSHNQKLASVAHKKQLATIDLSMASDHLSCTAMVRLFPERWISLLELFRCEKTQLPDGTWINLEKFSSQGNGFNFELETLVFLALVRSIVPVKEWDLTATYGDDIIVPRKYADEVIRGLLFLGFKPNLQKTFLEGRFFESCGADYFDGVNVRPFYFRKEKSPVPFAMKIANQIRLYSYNGYYCDCRFRSIWLKLYNSTPKSIRRCKVPQHYGDSGFIVDRQETTGERHHCYEDTFYSYQIVIGPVKRRYRDIFVVWASYPVIPTLFSIPISDRVATYGREPKRGYLRRVRTVKKPLWFPSDFKWA